MILRMSTIVYPPDTTIVQSSAIGPQIHQILRQQIIRGQFLPGTRLSESECAATFSVSRQPVREAFIKLSEEGLVEVRPQRGTLVRRISEEAVLEARFVREAIEADVVKRIIALGDTHIVRELRAQLSRQKEVPADHPAEFLGLDELFHRTLAEAAGVAHAWKVTEGIKAQMDRVRYLSFNQMQLPRLITQHTAIVNAIEHQDASGADKAIRMHLRQILHDLPEIRAAHPDLFDDSRSSLIPI